MDPIAATPDDKGRQYEITIGNDQLPGRIFLIGNDSRYRGDQQPEQRNEQKP